MAPPTGDDVFPIFGTKNPNYLLENIAGFDIKLSQEEMAELEDAVPHEAVIHKHSCHINTRFANTKLYAMSSVALS